MIIDFVFIQAHEKCKQIQGFIVEFPIEFLLDNINTTTTNNNNNIKPYKQHQPPQQIAKIQQYSQPNFINSQYAVK